MNDLSTGIVYQVYLRSFLDGNGDGIGDFSGLLKKLPHIKQLGCDAIWLNPCYKSPKKDHGYDISDYRQIDSEYGTLDDFKDFINEAHYYGLKVLMDMVANHSSSEHPWFQKALMSAPGSPERKCYLFANGKGELGTNPPNDCKSVFGGSAWTKAMNTDGQIEQ